MAVYLLHFTIKLGNPHTHEAQHYVGTATNPEARLQEHLAGAAAKITRAAVAAGAQLLIVRTWSGSRTEERQLKRRHDFHLLCPLCHETARARKTAHQRERRHRRRQAVPPLSAFTPDVPDLAN